VLVLGVVAGLSKVGGQAWWKDAMVAPVLQTAVLAVKPFLPPSVGERISFSDAPRSPEKA
jgi:membrane protein required for colicin V production